MKPIFFITLLLILSLSVHAQQHTDRVDWAHYEALAKTHPDTVNNFLRRAFTPEGKLDPRFPLDDIGWAYLVQSYLSEGKEWLHTEEAFDLWKLGNAELAYAKAKQALTINPLNLQCLQIARRAAFALLKDNKDPQLRLAFNQCFTLEKALIDAIHKSGDGSLERPFVVTSMDDEYILMQTALGLRQLKMQSLLKGGIDQLEIEANPAAYPHPLIHFDARRCLELVQKRMQ